MSAGEPYLNDRVYAYLDDNGKIELGKYSIKFLSIRDYESATITLFHEGTDLVFEMPYGVSVQEFLDSNLAPSGRYKIVEKIMLEQLSSLRFILRQEICFQA